LRLDNQETFNRCFDNIHVFFQKIVQRYNKNWTYARGKAFF
jgi:hypothetical protein